MKPKQQRQMEINQFTKIQMLRLQRANRLNFGCLKFSCFIQMFAFRQTSLQIHICDFRIIYHIVQNVMRSQAHDRNKGKAVRALFHVLVKMVLLIIFKYKVVALIQISDKQMLQILFNSSINEENSKICQLGQSRKYTHMHKKILK